MVWYFWAVAAGLEIGIVPVVGGDALLYGGIVAALVTGTVEAATKSESDGPAVTWERDADPADTD